MKPRRVHRIIMPVLALLAVVVSLGWIGQAMADEQTVMVYKDPT